MADARVTIEGAIASDPRYNTTGDGTPVANIRVLAGRSRKNDDGTWETLSTTAYDVSFWRAHAELASNLGPEKGSKVVVTGTITGVESYQGQKGESLSVKVDGEGLRVFPKRDQGGFQGQPQGGFQQQSQQGYPPQGQQQGGWGQQGGQWGDPQQQSAPF